jgi:hypothetical protein
MAGSFLEQDDTGMQCAKVILHFTTFAGAGRLSDYEDLDSGDPLLGKEPGFHSEHRFRQPSRLILTTIERCDAVPHQQVVL